jgi:hypothetical protein
VRNGLGKRSKAAVTEENKRKDEKGVMRSKSIHSGAQALLFLQNAPFGT